MRSLFVCLILVAGFNCAAQNVGIGTTTPVARLHVADSNVLFTGPSTVPITTTFYPPAQGPGTRMMWYPQKAAFRVGYTDNNSWDFDNIGTYSIATGYSSIASGNYSTAMGVNTLASGDASTAMGGGTEASGDYSTAIGIGTTASGYYSTAMGVFTGAFGDFSTALGHSTQATGNYSTAIGNSTLAKSFNETSIGAYNTDYTPSSATVWDATDRLFTIGNGTTSSRSDAMVVLKNGNNGFGTSNPTARLHVADSGVLFTGPSTVPITTTFYPPAQGPGTRMMWYPQKAAFRVGYTDNNSWDFDNIGTYSIATGYSSIASGNYSTAMGVNTLASGDASTAMGGGTEASGDYSTAIGIGTTASGYYSTAMGVFTGAFGDFSTALGHSTQATGNYSTAIGNSTLAKSFNETSIGAYNTDYTPSSATVWDATDRLFTIGNGTTSSRSDAMVVLKNGNNGFGTSNPTARLHVADSGVLFTGPSTVPLTTTYYPPAQGAGTRMMWYPQKAALRVGYTNGDSWDFNNIGTYSFATGHSTKASGFISTASGYSTIASGNYSTAMGSETIASGDASTAIGVFTTASGNYSIATGLATIASGNGSTAMGNSTLAKSFSEMSIGSYNTDYTPSSATVWDATDRLFTIGNGTTSSRSDAMVILKNGNTGIGTSTPNTKLDVAGVVNATGGYTQVSDSRYKKNITDLSGSLNNLLRLRGSQYYFNNTDFPAMNFSSGKQMGVIAQEVEKIFPELVTTDKVGYKSVNYIGLIPVMIESIKEQQTQIEKQNQQIEKLIRLVNQLLNK